MGFTLSNFREKFSDLGRQYMFKANFTGLPGGLDPDMKEEDISLLVLSTTMPKKNITAIDAKFMGQQLKLAGDVEYPAWTCTFRSDIKNDLYSLFRSWVDLVRRPETGNMNLANNYKGNLGLNLLDSEQKPIAGIGLYGVFPTDLGDLTFNTTSSEIQEFVVTFEYDYNIYTNN